MLIEHNEITADLWKILTYNGYDHQKIKAIEELSELAEELARDLNRQGNREKITEEMADVYLMLTQLELIYGNHDGIVPAIREKVDRTLHRIEEEKRGIFKKREVKGL